MAENNDSIPRWAWAVIVIGAIFTLLNIFVFHVPVVM